MQKNKAYEVLIKTFNDLERGDDPVVLKRRLNGWAAFFCKNRLRDEARLVRQVMKGL